MYRNKNLLLVTSVASMIDQFMYPNIMVLIEMGYEVDVAANFINGNNCNKEKINQLISQLTELNIDCYQIDFSRSAFSLKDHFKAYFQLDKVVNGKAKTINIEQFHRITKDKGYSIIHSNSPIGGVVGRLIGKKNKIKNIYTAHGFHFYTGAPLINWVLFYPIEKILSSFTNVLVTINREDYIRAKQRFSAKKTVYIPGIGLDIDKFKDISIDIEKKRKELGLENGDIMFLSVGELNKNKNHKIVIEAMHLLNGSGRLHYFIAGKDAGEYKKLINLAERFSVNLHLLGFRTDIPELLKTADFFILPSIREGLNVGLMEAMASGIPCIVSNIRGNVDLIDEHGGLTFVSEDVKGLSCCIKKALSKNFYYIIKHNRSKIQFFSIAKVKELLRKLYE